MKFPILLKTRKQMKLCEIVHTITHSIPLVPALATVPRRSATLASEMETRWRRGGLTRLLRGDFLGVSITTLQDGRGILGFVSERHYH